MRKRVQRPSPALVISLIALFVAMGGVGYAAVKIDGKNLKNKSVAGKKLKNKTIGGGKVKADTLTGVQINESTLGKVPSATTADKATTADTAGSAAPSGPAGGSLTGTFPNPTLAANSVGAAQIAANVVGSSELGTITERSATSTTMAAGTGGSVTVNCLPGETILSGGNDGFTDVWVAASRRNGANGWSVFGFNNSAGNRTITVRAYCLAP